MSSKLGRNDPCWCGSGKKFKKCHQNREEEKPQEAWEIDQELRKGQNNKLCSCPPTMLAECQGKIINAHTVSKSGSLKQIAKNGHVYGFLPTLKKLIESKGKFEPELVGINKASTFTGFCAHHDKNLFSCFEDEPYAATPEQNFLLSYRSVSKEVYAKVAQGNTQEIMKKADKGKQEIEQLGIQAFAKHYGLMSDIGLRDLMEHKKQYDTILENKDYTQIRSYLVEFDKILPIQCSGSFCPKVDFNNNPLQDFNDLETVLDSISFSIFSDNGKSYALFGWLESSDETCIKFIESFKKLNDSIKSRAIMNFTFYTFENVYMSPDWWDTRVFKFKTHIKNTMSPESYAHTNYLNGIEHDFGEFNVVKEASGY